MTLKEILELLVAAVVLMGSILGGPKVLAWKREMDGMREGMGALDKSCKDCRAEVLAHHQAVAIHRDPERDGRERDELMKRLQRIEDKIDGKWGINIK